jgi:hypothetical protein
MLSGCGFQQLVVKKTNTFATEGEKTVAALQDMYKSLNLMDQALATDVVTSDPSCLIGKKIWMTVSGSPLCADHATTNTREGPLGAPAFEQKNVDAHLAALKGVSGYLTALAGYTDTNDTKALQDELGKVNGDLSLADKLLGTKVAASDGTLTAIKAAVGSIGQLIEQSRDAREIAAKVESAGPNIDALLDRLSDTFTGGADPKIGLHNWIVETLNVSQANAASTYNDSRRSLGAAERRTLAAEVVARWNAYNTAKNTPVKDLDLAAALKEKHQDLRRVLRHDLTKAEAREEAQLARDGLVAVLKSVFELAKQLKVV